MQKAAISDQYFNKALFQLLKNKIKGAKTYGAITGAMGGSGVGGTVGLVNSIKDQNSGEMNELTGKEIVKRYLHNMLVGGGVGLAAGIPVGVGGGALWRNGLAGIQRRKISDLMSNTYQENFPSSSTSEIRKALHREVFKSQKNRPATNLLKSFGKLKKASVHSDNTIITTGIHGDEKASREAGKELAKEYDVVDVGNHSNKREYKGKDLNRSFDDKYKSDIVSYAIKNIKSKKPKNIVDLHEDDEADGAYAYASKNMENKARNTLHKGTTMRLANKVKEDVVDRGVIVNGKYPPKGSLVKEMERKGVSYVLYETPTNVPLRDRINFHKEKVKQLVDKV